jgi:uncharacterized protein (TIGR00299 family) protein
MRIAYLDCFAGISGDMFLGALLGAGVPPEVLERAVVALGVNAGLRFETVDRSGISSVKVHVFEGGRLAEGVVDSAVLLEHEDVHAHSHSPENATLHGHSHTHEDAKAHSHSHPHEHSNLHPHADSDLHTHEDSRSHSHEDAHSHEQAHPHAHGRSLTKIRELIRACSLEEPVKEFAVRAFELLGHSEAKIHNVPVEQIHFHEVGAVDAIADIVAASAGIAYLNEQGPIEWFCSPVNVGGGMVACAHGTFPVPAPATADLLRGMPTYSAHVQKELVTPTGAALLRALAPGFGPQPAMRVQSIGYGAGTRNPKGFPNVLRLSLGEADSADSVHDTHTRGHVRKAGFEETRADETVMMLEAALDDASPQLLAHVAERALEAGALDVMLAPVVMKKGRAATLLTVLCEPGRSAELEALLLRETTTLGLRKHREERVCLDRRHVRVSTEFGEIRVKIGSLEEEELNVMPEYEDCRAAAREHDVPLKQVMQAALAAYACVPAR